MNRLLRADLVAIFLIALAALPPTLSCRPAGGGAPLEGMREGALFPTPKKPLEIFLDSLATNSRERRDPALWAQLRRFYEGRAFAPAWIASGLPSPRAGELLRAIDQAAGEALDPLDYPLRDLATRLERIDRRGPVPETEIFSLDIALSHAFLRYGTDLARGRLAPGRTERGWHITPRTVDLAPALVRATGSGDLRPVLAGLAPGHPAYARLRDALPRYREIAASGGWPLVPEGPTLRPGDSADADRLEALAARLAREGTLEAPERKQTRGTRYDVRLSDGLRAFQARHGLEPDGVLGANTLLALNVPARTRANQIALNMERWRRMPEDFGPRHLFANVPAFRLELYEGERIVGGMKVIVGKDGWGTPIFRAELERIILHPDWRVPTSIAAKEILPKLRADPSYLSKNHMEVLSLRSGTAVAPSSIRWSKVTAAGFPYRLRQVPGDDNPLGRFKFDLPNPYGVYLHDTSSPRLFGKEMRAFSHGCIRVERPMDLALWLLAPEPDWTLERVEETLRSPGTRRVGVRPAVPTYITYWTASADEDGAVEFFPDLYALDAALDEALRARRR